MLTATGCLPARSGRLFLVRPGCVLFLLLLAGASGCPGKEAPKGAPAILKIKLADEDAEIRVDDAPRPGRGLERTVETAPLQEEVAHTVTVAAVMKPNNYTTRTRTRKVSLRARQIKEVDLQDEDPKNPDDIQVIYVPTPQEVVDAMCELAKVGPNDVVYDLGCGDGRIVITAIKKYGAKRGKGVDINPIRVRESSANAQSAGIADKVVFTQEDVQKLTDVSEASVVMLYMGEDLNLIMRPVLQKTLKPGSRVVSHKFTMGDWEPHDMRIVEAKKGGQIRVYLWIIGK